MKDNEMCAILGKAHEFFLALKKAGFSEELIQEVINSKDNAMAKKMLAAISLKKLEDNEGDSIKEIEAKAKANILSFPVQPTADYFIVNKRISTKVNKKSLIKISFIDYGFNRRFVRIIEQPSAGSIIYGCDISEKGVDSPLYIAMNSQGKSPIMLAEIYQLLLAQPNGEDGIMLNNGFGNVFFVGCQPGDKMAIVLFWNVAGWVIRSFNESATEIREAHGRVFSHHPFVVEK